MDMPLERIKKLCSEKRYAEALALITEMEASGFVTSQLLVTKAMCLQVTDDSGSLDEVERTFVAALNIDQRCVEALVEFGWFQLNVKDDARKAESLFRKALEAQAASNTEIISGVVRCRQEVSPTESSTSLVRELKGLLVEDSKLQDIVNQ